MHETLVLLSTYPFCMLLYGLDVMWCSFDSIKLVSYYSIKIQIKELDKSMSS